MVLSLRELIFADSDDEAPGPAAAPAAAPATASSRKRRRVSGPGDRGGEAEASGGTATRARYDQVALVPGCVATFGYEALKATEAGRDPCASWRFVGGKRTWGKHGVAPSGTASMQDRREGVVAALRAANAGGERGRALRAAAAALRCARGYDAEVVDLACVVAARERALVAPLRAWLGALVRWTKAAVPADKFGGVYARIYGGPSARERFEVMDRFFSLCGDRPEDLRTTSVALLDFEKQDGLDRLDARASKVRRAYCHLQGRKRVIQRRFNVCVLEAIPKRKASTL